MPTTRHKESGGRVIRFGDYRAALPRRVGSDDSELTAAEYRLLRALALYRRAIPQTHRLLLERQLSAGGAWEGLVGRGYIIAADVPWHVTLLSPFGTLPVCGDPADGQQRLRELHGALASCWLQELAERGSLFAQVRIRACEALYHLTAAGDDLRIGRIPPELLSADLPWARRQLRSLYDTLYQGRMPVSRQRQLLQYRLRLDPDNHALHRYLGQCWQKEEGKGSRRAVDCFETACRLQPDFPPYLADLGQALLAAGRAGAQQFLARLENVALTNPAAINSYVAVVRIACIKAVRGGSEAAVERSAAIGTGSVNPVLYADEAHRLLKRGDCARAVAVIDAAELQGCGNDVTAAVKAAALQQLGRTHEAAALRLERIALGSSNPALYCDEARTRLKGGDHEGALAILDLAQEKQIANDYVLAIRATVLEKVGRGTEAAAIRLAKITAASRSSVFYNDEANVRLGRGDFDGAREILGLAVKYNCANQVTSVLWAKTQRLEAEGRG